MSFSSPILLSATSQLTGTASATFNNTINGAFNLGITSTGAVTFNSGANIGAVAAPTSLNVTGVSISVGANQKANPAILGQVMSYTGPVTITAPVAFTDVGLNALIFSSTITGNFPLTLNPHSRPFPLGAL